MSSLVYFKFKASVKTDSISFEGSAISVKDLKNSIRTKCCLYSQDFDLKLEDSNGKVYVKDEDLIPKYAKIIVCRVPKLNTEGNKKKPNLYDTSKKDNKSQPMPSEVPGSNNLNLAKSDIPEEEKIRMMMEKSSEIYSEKNYAVKAKPYHFPPSNYTCHKCGKPGHWIHNCPGVQDSSGKMIDLKSVKRPTGIPQDFLLEVNAGTPGAYLSKTGSYMVPKKDAEAYALGKKDKIPFSIEENPPYVSPEEKKHPSYLICPLCSELFKDAVVVSCCGTTYCNDCVVGHVFDSQIKGSGKCPNCSSQLSSVESSLVENTIVRKIITDLNNESNTDHAPTNAPVVPTEKTFVDNRRVLRPKHRNTDGAPGSGKENEMYEQEDVKNNNPYDHDVHLNVDGTSSVNNNNVLSKHSIATSSSSSSLLPFNKQTNSPRALTPTPSSLLMASIGGGGIGVLPLGSGGSKVMLSSGLIDPHADPRAVGLVAPSSNNLYHAIPPSSHGGSSLEHLINPSTNKILSKEEFERLKRELIQNRKRQLNHHYSRRTRSRSHSGSYRSRHRRRRHSRERRSDSRERHRNKRRHSPSPPHEVVLLDKGRLRHDRHEESRRRHSRRRHSHKKERRCKDFTPISDTPPTNAKEDQLIIRRSNSRERLITLVEARNLSPSPHRLPSAGEKKSPSRKRTRSRSESFKSAENSHSDSKSREDSIEPITPELNLKKSKKDRKTALQIEEGEVLSNDGHKKKKKKHRTPEEKEAKRLRKLARKEKRLAKARKKALKVIQSA